MLKYVIIIFLFALPILTAQNLSLEECFKLAKDNYPTKKQAVFYREIGEEKKKSLSVGYYPELLLLGQAQYQSDVTKVELNIPIPNIKIPQIPVPSKDQYKIGININQLIWDGGIISNQKEIETAQTEMNVKNVEVDLYGLKQRVNDAFFAVLVFQFKIKSLEESKKDLIGKLNTVNVRVENGVVLQSNSLILQAEILKLEQSIDDLKASKSTFQQILEELIHQKINASTALETPVQEIKQTAGKRPEYEVFSQTMQNLEKTKDLADSRNYPKFSAYLQAMYDKPGLNMFDNTFQPFWIAGLRGTWNIWNWNVTDNDKQILEKQKAIVGTQMEAFTENLKIASHKFLNDVDRLNAIIDKDAQIIKLREKIMEQVSNQLDNGAITATEFLTEFTQLLMAKLNLESHKIELQQAKVNYNTLMGFE